MICAKCDQPMESAEATGYMNQTAHRVSYSAKPEAAGALEVHLHSKCKKAMKDKPHVLPIAVTDVGRGPLGIVR